MRQVPQTVSVKEAAGALGVSYNAVLWMIDEGKLAGVHAGRYGRWTVQLSDVQRLQRHRIANPTRRGRPREALMEMIA